jgi:hypothetical protein
MDEFLSNLYSLSWWLGVVVVGILINIISPYLNKGMDKILMKTSATFKNKTMERLEKRKQKIDELKADPHKQIMFSFREQRLRIRTLFGLLGGFLFAFISVFIGFLIVGTHITMNKYLFMAFTGLPMLYSLIRLTIAFNDNRTFVGLRKILDEVNPDTADSNIIDWL